MNLFLLFLAAFAIVAGTAKSAAVQSDAISNPTLEEDETISDEEMKKRKKKNEELLRCAKSCPKKKDSPLCMVSGGGRMETLSARDVCKVSCAIILDSIDIEFRQFFNRSIVHKGECQKTNPSPLMQCLMKALDEFFDLNEPVCIKTERGDRFTVDNLEVYQCWKQYRSFRLHAKGKCPGPELDKFTTCSMTCTNTKEPICAKTKKGQPKTVDNWCKFGCSQRFRSFQFVHVGKCR